MTNNEFQTWLTDFTAAFPGLGEWIEKLPAKKATMRHWFENVFVNIEFADAWAVTRRMFKGDDAMVAAYDREKLPQIIASLADRARDRRLNPTGEFIPEYVEAGNRKKKFDLIGICSKIQAAMKGGMSPIEACEKHLPATDPEEAPRYKCLDCRDTGMVSVWHVTAMAAAKRGTFDRKRHTSLCKIRCRCFAGDRYPAFSQTYNPDKWLRVENASRQEEIDRLHAYMKSYGVKSCDYDQFVFQGSDGYDAFKD